MSIKLLEFDCTQIEVIFAGKNNLWRLSKAVEITMKTNEGVLRYSLLPGFPTDMRSGASIINPLIPKFTANNKYNGAILAHDFNYSKMANGENPVSRLVADILLRDGVKLSGELGSFKASIMYNAVRLGGCSAYNSPNEGDYKGMEQYMKFSWGAK